MTEKNIFRLYISVDDQLFMNIVYSFTDLPHDQSHIIFLHSSFLAQLLQELAVRTKLNQQVNIFLIREVTVQRSNISMTQIKLNTELTSNLSNIVFIPNLFLLHDLHTTDESRLLMLDQ